MMLSDNLITVYLIAMLKSEMLQRFNFKLVSASVLDLLSHNEHHCPSRWELFFVLDFLLKCIVCVLFWIHLNHMFSPKHFSYYHTWLSFLEGKKTTFFIWVQCFDSAFIGCLLPIPHLFSDLSTLSRLFRQLKHLQTQQHLKLLNIECMDF